MKIILEKTDPALTCETDKGIMMLAIELSAKIGLPISFKTNLYEVFVTAGFRTDKVEAP